jgi:hypothetical protein
MNKDGSCDCNATHLGKWNTTQDQNGCDLLVPTGESNPEDDAGIHDMEPDMPVDMGVDMSGISSPISCLDGEHMCEPSPLTPGKYCCPRTGPSCDCSYTGGTLGPFGACDGVCDAVPLGWTTTVDENGCVIDIPNGDSCLVPPEDMGKDMTINADM